MGNGHIGEYLESIADMVSLSIAPLALFYKTYYDVVVSQLWMHLLLVVVLVLSLVCSMIRLSSFSLFKEKHFFIGLPTSASAVFLVLSSFLKVEMLYILPFVVVLAFAMISPIHFPKLGLKIDLVAALFIVATIVLDGLYNNFTPILFLVALAGYIIIGPMYLRKRTRYLT
jgi:CDP-diacylglycerol--serine O-phosphatidyltransferase